MCITLSTRWTWMVLTRARSTTSTLTISRREQVLKLQISTSIHKLLLFSNLWAKISQALGLSWQTKERVVLAPEATLHSRLHRLNLNTRPHRTTTHSTNRTCRKFLIPKGNQEITHSRKVHQEVWTMKEDKQRLREVHSRRSRVSSNLTKLSLHICSSNNKI